MKLFDAVYNGKLDDVYKCIFEEVDVHEVNSVGNQAIHAAAYAGNCQIAKLLLRAGAKADAKGRAGNTPLHYACMKGHTEMVDLLLRSSAQPTHLNAKGSTPKHICEKSLEELESEPIPEPQRTKQLENLKKCMTLLDSWILERCSFLRVPSVPAPKSPLPSTTTTQPTGQWKTSTTTPSAFVDGKAVLDIVKPLIADARMRTSTTPLHTPPSRQCPLAPAIPIGPLKSNLEKVSIEDGNPSQENGEREVEDDTRTNELKPQPESTKRGYIVEIDGKEVFIPEIEGDSEEDEEVTELDNDIDVPSEGDENDGKDSGEEDDVNDAAVDRYLEENDSSHLESTVMRDDNFIHVVVRPSEFGLGMQLEESGHFTRVSNLHPSGPAKAAGVKLGDVLCRINGTNTQGHLLGKVMHLLKVERELNEELELSFFREF